MTETPTESCMVMGTARIPQLPQKWVETCSNNARMALRSQGYCVAKIYLPKF